MKTSRDCLGDCSPDIAYPAGRADDRTTQTSSADGGCTQTWDTLSGGRVVFGAGIGSMDIEYSAFGENPDLRDRGRRLDESLTQLTDLWSGQDVLMPSGERVRMQPTPVQQPRIPVWRAGRWPNRPGLRRAARWDGVVVTFADAGRTIPVPVEDFADAVRYVASERGSLDGSRDRARGLDLAG